MKSMIVELTWDDEDLGECWMNPDNLRMLLYNSTHTTKDLLQVEVIEEAGNETLV